MTNEDGSGQLTHLDERGRARMVDIATKEKSSRVAVAQAIVRMRSETLQLINSDSAPKGDVLAVARIAGIQAAKKVPQLIPLCHQVALTACKVDFESTEDATGIRVTARAEALDRTGVEMEALTAASVAALTIYDMLKAKERGMVIDGLHLVAKTGGARGDYRAE